MCRYAEWESLVHRIEEAVEDERVRDLVSEAGARVHALIHEIMVGGCVSDNAARVRRHGRRSRSDWIA